MDEGDIAVDQGVPRRPVRDDLLVGDDVGGVVRGAEGFLALQIPGDEHTGGQLGVVDLALADQAVPHIRHAVRRDEAHMPRRVPRQRQHGKPRPVHVDVVVLGEDNAVSGEALLQKDLPALAVGQRHVVGAVAVRIHGDPRFNKGDGGLRAVFFLQIPHVARVVKVGVGAQHGAQTPALPVDEVCQRGAIQLGVARVDEHHLPVVELVDGQQRGGGRCGVGIAEDVQKFHGISLRKRCFPHYTPPRRKNNRFLSISAPQGMGTEKRIRKIFVFPLCKP